MNAYTFTYHGTLTVEATDCEAALNMAWDLVPEDASVKLEDITPVNPED